MKESNLDISGAVTCWRTVPSDRGVLEGGLMAIGMAGLSPKQRTPKAVLHSALRARFANSRRLVRPLKARAAFTVVNERRGLASNSYDEQRCVSVDDGGSIDVSPWDSEVYREVLAAYRDEEKSVPGEAVTGILVKALRDLNGIPLKPTGGVYWIPESRLPQWSRLVAVVEAAGLNGEQNAVYVMRTARDADAIRAIRDGIVADLESEIAQIKADIDDPAAGEQMLQARVAYAMSLKRRADEYENILGTGLDAMQAKIAEVTKAASTGIMLIAARNALV